MLQNFLVQGKGSKFIGWEGLLLLYMIKETGVGKSMLFLLVESIVEFLGREDYG